MAKNLLKATGLLFVINLCVKLLGFLREMVLASAFGASSYTDAYLAAYTLPYFFQAILGYAFVSAVLPELSDCWNRQNDAKHANRLGSTLINLIAVITLILSILGVVFARPLIALTAPGLSGATEQMAVDMTRIIFPSMLFMSVGMVISGVLNSRYRFAAAAIAPGVCNLVIIGSVLLVAGQNIYFVAWGTLLGFVAFFLVQAADLPHTCFRYHLCCDRKDPAVHRVLRDLVPIILALSVTQIYTVINRIFASSLAEGSISALNYANKLINLPLAVFVAAIVIAAFPALAEKALEKDGRELTDAVKKALGMVLVIAVPSAVGLMLLDGEIIRLLFQRGSFTAENAAMTTSALTPMAAGLIFLGVSMLLIRVYFALRDVKTPVIAGLISIAANILLSLALVGAMDVAGLSLANTLAAAVNAVLLLAGLARRLPIFSDGDILKTVWKTCLACAVMCVPVELGRIFWPHMSTKLGLTCELLALIAGAILVFLAVLKLLRCRVLEELLAALLKRRRKKA